MPTPIRRVRIEGFKRFVDVEFVLPGHIVVAGPNNTGKTTRSLTPSSRTPVWVSRSRTSTTARLTTTFRTSSFG